MSEKGEKRAVAVAERSPATAGKQETKYQVEKLRENCVKLFNVSTSTFDGAFHGNTAQEMTINEAMSRINKWLGRKE